MDFKKYAGLGCLAVSETIEDDLGHAIMLLNFHLGGVVAGGFEFCRLRNGPFEAGCMLQEIQGDHRLIKNHLAVIRSIDKGLGK